ncbi:hypothetical protein DM02DRAFT_652423 [Periconia macrospinosa]|uniref:Uncharacterized protein n=1 Tax=Periconia macrospinosa TaxID=97972 RepID=A0A2V1DZR3_9PLEO|nr:hypothetical protein DM02DRAFT_652423 [Periconia macrospinosa]
MDFLPQDVIRNVPLTALNGSNTEGLANTPVSPSPAPNHTVKDAAVENFRRMSIIILGGWRIRMCIHSNPTPIRLHSTLPGEKYSNTSSTKLEIDKAPAGEKFVDEADVIVNARRVLNNYIWPNMDGLWFFKVQIMNFAAWDETFNLSNKRIGIISGGSSAIQTVPELQKLEGSRGARKMREFDTPNFAEGLYDVQ